MYLTCHSYLDKVVAFDSSVRRFTDLWTVADLIKPLAGD